MLKHFALRLENVPILLVEQHACGASITQRIRTKLQIQMTVCGLAPVMTVTKTCSSDMPFLFLVTQDRVKPHMTSVRCTSVSTQLLVECKHDPRGRGRCVPAHMVCVESALLSVFKGIVKGAKWSRTYCVISVGP